MRDSELIDLLRNQKQDGINILLEKYGPLMKYIIEPILSDYREQEECISDVAYKVWDKIDSFDELQGSFNTWLSVITRNTAFNRAKKNHRNNEAQILSEDIPSTNGNPEEKLLQKERMNKLHNLLQTLDSKDRMLIYRKYYYLQTTEQIAAELGLTIRAVEGRLYRIKTRLRGEWNE